MTTTDLPPTGTSAALAQRILDAVTGSLELAALHLGSELGWYRALAEAPATAPELAERTGTDARYAREWLEQQAVAGYLTVDDVAAAPDARRYTLPPEHRGVLVEETDPSHMAPFARIALAFTRNVPRLVEAYRTGDGLGWAEMGDARDAQAAANRPYFLGALVTEDLPSLPEVDAALRAGGRVADVGCGMGWSSIGIARAYPQARVDGFDVDAPSVQAARRNAEAAGVADRVLFRVADAGAVADAEGRYALVAAFECVHDLPDPVSVLAAMRGMAAPGGTVLVVDERVAEEFTAPGDDVERLMYGYSLTCCLPDGRATRPSVGTGTVMRPATLERYAREAGYAGVDVLPVDNDFFRFYRLRTGG
ncbi:class I SAM-dependent methyltransferase [Geodermatophilus marinus]|uniref:class I SAM-dependent methyltransferase n=1 Tax=Geodermatophilus sp. LHW52908 TaxID=2303986 RepID=UPI000E3D8B43|nr:class I SAM-dependent methyltransferase [Geodermatophilus sp. LHW52908]RFU20229.1 methyltransferase domain-containing protein [Geodermatophilus sp. LHW52908]